MALHPIRSFEHFLASARHGDYQSGSAASRSPLVGRQVRLAQGALDAALPPSSTLGLLAYMLGGGLPEGAFGRGLGAEVGPELRGVPKALFAKGIAPHRAEYANLRGLARSERGSIGGHHPGHPGIKIGGPAEHVLRASPTQTGRAIKASSIPEHSPPPEGYLFRRPNLDRQAAAALRQGVKPGPTARQMAGQQALALGLSGAGIGGLAALGYGIDKGIARRKRVVVREHQHYGLH